MATVINNPAPTQDRTVREVHVEREDTSGWGFVVGLIVLILAAILLFAYGIPALRGTSRNTGTNVNVPKDINVKVNTPSPQQ